MKSSRTKLMGEQIAALLPTMPRPATYEAMVVGFRELLLEAGRCAAKILNEEPPTVREAPTAAGFRLAVVWPDGKVTCEMVVEPTEEQGRAA